MFKLILKTLWARRRRNGWLLAELILVAVLSWAIFDPVLVLTHDRRLPLGFDPDRLCLLSVDMLHPQAPGYDPAAADSAGRVDAFLNLVQRVRQHPDVELSTPVLGYSFPCSQGNTSGSYTAEGDSVDRNVGIIYYLPRTQFFETYGFQPCKGPSPDELSDASGFQLVLTESTLRTFFHTDDPRGKRFWECGEGDTTYIPVSGAVGTIRYRTTWRPNALGFLPMFESDLEGDIPDNVKIVLRLKEGVSMERFVHDFQPWMLSNVRAGNLYGRDLTPYSRYIHEQEGAEVGSIYQRNLLVAVFFLVNLCLGVVGTFWLQTRTRREEIGVMLSFGATPRRIVGLLLGEGAVLTTLSVLVGCFIYLQYALSEGLAVSNDWIQPTETYWLDSFPLHFLAVSAFVYVLLLVVVLVGVYIPARRISRIPPTEALRDE